ncbi:cation:proton antiporter [Dyadobacter sp. CY261]|uniref:cation:proton antiporter n=1 Tax=Dyadobacter sp. CY261 TaxID=2907203 RepID=UPI001F2E60EF|nr:cation:proton antiporter [Dyadobacter sp. CY261]MCF0069967.1 cation:proton antiporter [Dyadobacter sp. CY261]
MKNIRNVLFYIITIGVFSALLYFFIRQGTFLEKAGQITQKQLSTSSWEQFKDTFGHNIHHPLATLLLQIITIIIVARLFGWICKVIGQPTVIGEIAAGIFLGPSLLGMFYPEISALIFPATSLGNLQFLSQVGLILFMFIIGMELDLNVLKTKAQEAIVISHASIILPFALGVGLALYMYSEFAPEGISFLSFSLFIGIALSITAFPVLARIVQERGLSRTRLGMMVITCAATDDITAWCILAAVIAIVKAGEFVSAIYTIILALAYVVVMLQVVKPVLKRVGDHYAYREGLTKPVVALFFLMLLFSAYCTELIGIHALFGAFMAGVIMPANQRFRNIFIEKVEDVSLVLLLPLFFVFTGLRTQIGLLNDPHLWFVTGLIIAAAVIGKFIGSAVAARFVKQSWRDSLIIGSLMNTRGLMELVVLNIGYDIGVLSPEIFAMMVIMALATTCMTGPAMDLIDKFLPAKKWEEQHSVEPSRFSILIAFASPQGGRKMFRLANKLIAGQRFAGQRFAGQGILEEEIDSQPAEQHITALHLSPSSYLSQVNTEEYQYETFRPINEEAHSLDVTFTSLFKPSQNIEHDIIETANDGEFDMLLIGIGRSVFEGTFLGKILGFTSRFASRERLFDTISGREKLFHKDVFDERTAHIIKSVKAPVGILIEKNLEQVNDVFMPLFTPEDRFLLPFAERLAAVDGLRMTIMDPSQAVSQHLEVGDALNALLEKSPENVTLLYENALEKDFLKEKDLMVISLESWKKAVESHSVWLSNSPSVLIIRG